MNSAGGRARGSEWQGFHLSLFPEPGWGWSTGAAGVEGGSSGVVSVEEKEKEVARQACWFASQAPAVEAEVGQQVRNVKPPCVRQYWRPLGGWRRRAGRIWLRWAHLAASISIFFASYVNGLSSPKNQDIKGRGHTMTYDDSLVQLFHLFDCFCLLCLMLRSIESFIHCQMALLPWHCIQSALLPINVITFFLHHMLLCCVSCVHRPWQYLLWFTETVVTLWRWAEWKSEKPVLPDL